MTSGLKCLTDEAEYIMTRSHFHHVSSLIDACMYYSLSNIFCTVCMHLFQQKKQEARGTPIELS
jgi:hypothetical protein